MRSYNNNNSNVLYASFNNVLFNIFSLLTYYVFVSSRVFECQLTYLQRLNYFVQNLFFHKSLKPNSFADVYTFHSFNSVRFKTSYLFLNFYILFRISELKLKLFHLFQCSKGVLKSEISNTATCSIVCDHTGECQLLVGDMRVHDLINKSYVRIHEETIKQSALVVFDGNLPSETIDFLLSLCAENSIPGKLIF